MDYEAYLRDRDVYDVTTLKKHFGWLRRLVQMIGVLRFFVPILTFVACVAGLVGGAGFVTSVARAADVQADGTVMILSEPHFTSAADERMVDLFFGITKYSVCGLLVVLLALFVVMMARDLTKDSLNDDLLTNLVKVDGAEFPADLPWRQFLVENEFGLFLVDVVRFNTKLKQVRRSRDLVEFRPMTGEKLYSMTKRQLKIVKTE